MKLPDKFKERIKNDLGSEYEEFMEIYKNKPCHGIRINTAKITREEFLDICPFELKDVPWDRNGFIYDEESCKPSKHPFYHAGLYYIQEPSAMAPANLLHPEKGDCVIDLCAAPGGKSIQLSAMVKDEGLLVCNDINPKRVRALIRNVEWFGIRNAVILNEKPEKLALKWKAEFDGVLTDVPCSGEGMFRRDSKAAENWKQYSGGICEEAQNAIIGAAGDLLRPGGNMVYSTCTFGRSENEDIVTSFVNSREDMRMGQIPSDWYISRGLNAAKNADGYGFGRIWPHRHIGEGHFLAVMQKDETDEIGRIEERNCRISSGKSEFDAAMNFMSENLIGYEDYIERLHFYGHKAYIRPEKSIGLDGLKFVRNGWYIGEAKNGRFVPSQAFAMGLLKCQAKRTIDFDANDQNVYRYLRGETLGLMCEKGWHLICVEGYPVGWGKGQNNFIKNCYDKNWRMH